MLIRREDFKNVEDLKENSNKRVWYRCENCGCGFLIKYRSYIKKRYGDLCNTCVYQSSAFKKDAKERTKNLWNDNNYRQEVSNKVSSSKKGKKRSINSKKEPYYYKLKEEMEKENYEILTSLNDYLKGNAYLSCQCPNGHIFNITYKEWFQQNKRCNECKEEDRKRRIEEICVRNNYEFLEIYTYNKKPYIKFKCEYGHLNDILLCNFFKGTKCARCVYDSRSSRGEHEIIEFLESLNLNVVSSDRTIINPYELDIYLPNYNLAIEYNGKWFHCEEYKGKNYHLMKTKKCEEKGIRLIHIFDDEWEFNRFKVENLLIQILNKGNEKVYARKCVVKEINYKVAKEFCEYYHLQNYGQSKVKLGLYHGNELVSVMTFSKPSISKGSVNKENVWEISRYCSSTNVIGGASKLLTYFKINYDWEIIYSYADRRWSNGNLYYKLGFRLEKCTEPNYWYWNKKKRDITRYHRYNFRKDKIKDWEDGDTEKEIMDYHGWSRIWDCGNLKFVIYNG